MSSNSSASAILTHLSHAQYPHQVWSPTPPPSPGDTLALRAGPSSASGPERSHYLHPSSANPNSGDHGSGNYSYSHSGVVHTTTVRPLQRFSSLVPPSMSAHNSYSANNYNDKLHYGNSSTRLSKGSGAYVDNGSDSNNSKNRTAVWPQTSVLNTTLVEQEIMTTRGGSAVMVSATRSMDASLQEATTCSNHHRSSHDPAQTNRENSSRCSIDATPSLSVWPVAEGSVVSLSSNMSSLDHKSESLHQQTNYNNIHGLQRQTSSPSLGWRSAALTSKQHQLQLQQLQQLQQYNMQYQPKQPLQPVSSGWQSTSGPAYRPLYRQKSPPLQSHPQIQTQSAALVPVGWGLADDLSPVSLTRPTSSASTWRSTQDHAWDSNSWQSSHSSSHARSSSMGWSTNPQSLRKRDSDRDHQSLVPALSSGAGGVKAAVDWLHHGQQQPIQQQQFGKSTWDGYPLSQTHLSLAAGDHSIATATTTGGWGESAAPSFLSALPERPALSLADCAFSGKDPIAERTADWVKSTTTGQSSSLSSTAAPSSASLARVPLGSVPSSPKPPAQQSPSLGMGYLRRVKSAVVLSDAQSRSALDQIAPRRLHHDYLQSRLADRVAYQRAPPDDPRRNSFPAVASGSTILRMSGNRPPSRSIEETSRTPLATIQDSVTTPHLTARRSRSSRNSSEARPQSTAAPIGIFVRGFPESTKIADLLQAFSVFGDILNVGIDAKKRHAFVDFENVQSTRAAIDGSATINLPTLTGLLEVVPRFEKTTTLPFTSATSAAAANYTGGSNVTPSAARPSCRSIGFDQDSLDANTCSRTVHLVNCPHNINKPELEAVFSHFNENKRIKIYQRSNERRASVFLTFRTPEIARKAASFVGARQRPVFRDMNEPVVVEFPAKDITMGPGSSGGDSAAAAAAAQKATPSSGDASTRGFKKSRRTAAAENRIVYVRQVAPEITSLEDLKKSFTSCASSIVSCHILPKLDSSLPSSAFVVFDAPQVAASAVASKSGSCTLPRHKRVDLPHVPWDISLQDLEDYLADAGDIKQAILPSEYDPDVPTAMVEFVSAVSAAKAIVLCRETIPKFGATFIKADYSSSLKATGKLEQGDNDTLLAASDGAIGQTSYPLVAAGSQSGPSLSPISTAVQPNVVTFSELTAHHSANASDPDTLVSSSSSFLSRSQNAVTMEELVVHASPAARVAISTGTTSISTSPFSPSHSEGHGEITFLSHFGRNPVNTDDSIEEATITLSQLSALDSCAK
ncbi:hypothetical protein BSLG_009092 [Batrachochytrium salamandrivorans]|nr:hypothetical protein BSLG_009092 [Batrachochytrium salamandrivorans]